jgi:predicted DNA-binding protein
MQLKNNTFQQSTEVKEQTFFFSIRLPQNLVNRLNAVSNISC